MLERRERLGGACTLERPFPDERYVLSPCAYVVGLLDRLGFFLALLFIAEGARRAMA